MSTQGYREHRVARLSELGPAPSMRPFEVDGEKILLVRLPGGLHAVSGLCPHAQAPLHEGALCGQRLVCPWHQSVFDVGSGELLDPPALDGLASFRVRTEGDDVFVTLPGAPSVARPRRATDRRMVLIVGAGAGGHVAAERLRAEGFAGRVVLVGPEPEAPYDRTNLTKHYLSGKARREDLPLRREPDFFKKIGVERRVDTVVRLVAATRSATLASGETLTYDAAILATGGTPKHLDIPGADDPRVRYLRTAADADEVIKLVAGPRKRVVAVGASFIGLEAVSSLVQRGAEATVLSPDEIPFARQLGREVGASLRRLHEKNGVRFLSGVKVARFAGSPDELTVVLGDGTTLATDVAIVGVGVRPVADFVVGAERTRDGAVTVDETLCAVRNLYAVGDIADFPLASGGRARIEHWRVAQQHAALAARNIVHAESPMSLNDSGFVPFFWTYHFEQRTNFVGHAPAWDEIILDGDPNSPPFVAYYLRNGRAVAAAGTHRDADLAAMHELIRLGQAPTATQLRAGGYSPLAEAGALQ